MYPILTPDFYNRDPSVVAPDLLGKYIVRKWKGDLLCGMITETEAYLPFDDEASHGFKRTKTRDSLYKRGGHAYVYGMRHHFLFNAVTEGENRPGGVLIRGVEPHEGITIMEKLRKRKYAADFTNGPAKVCQAFAITRREDGIDLTQRNGAIHIEDRGVAIKSSQIRISQRVGITKATDLMLRFYLDPAVNLFR